MKAFEDVLDVSLDKYLLSIQQSNPISTIGRVDGVHWMSVRSIGPQSKIGELCKIISGGKEIYSEVVGFVDNRVVLMPYSSLEGLGQGDRVVSTGKSLSIRMSEGLLGRVLNGFGEVMDHGTRQIRGHWVSVASKYGGNPLDRIPITEPLRSGIKSLDTLLTVGKGQRLGIFSGSGVGKSTLLGLIAKHSDADVHVIALIGERSREVRGFIEDALGKHGLERSVVIVSVADSPAIAKIKAGYVATSIAEFFARQGKHVVLMMDSLTRLARAQREIGLSMKEPVTTRGYPASVFSLIPDLVERAGNFPSGSITGFYTILLENDDLYEPVADNAKAILDGHIVLSRKLAEREQYPAIDVLSSISRVMDSILSKEKLEFAIRFKKYLSTYRDMEEMIRIGAYKEGSNVDVDVAIQRIARMESFLSQDLDVYYDFEESFAKLKQIVM